MSLKFLKTGSLVFLSLMVLSKTAIATDYFNDDLSGAVNLFGSYNNVDITNSRTIDYSDNFPFLYLSGDYQDSVNITNNGAISYSDEFYGIIYSARLGAASPGNLNMTVNNNGSMTTTGSRNITLYLRSDPISATNPMDFVLNNAAGALISTNSNISGSAIRIITYGNPGSHTINNSGTIISAKDTIVAADGEHLIINNSGTITAGAGGYAIDSNSENLDLNILEGSNISGIIYGSGINNLNIKKAISVTELNSLSSQLDGTWQKNLGNHRRNGFWNF